MFITNVSMERGQALTPKDISLLQPHYPIIVSRKREIELSIHKLVFPTCDKLLREDRFPHTMNESVRPERLLEVIEISKLVKNGHKGSHVVRIFPKLTTIITLRALLA